MLARSKLNSMKSKIFEALIRNEISHEGLMAIINEVRKYGKLKKSIRMMNNQGSDTEKINLIEKGKKTSTDEIIKQDEIINNSLKSKIWNNVILLFKV